MNFRPLCKSYNGTVLVAFHNTDWGWSDTLYFSGYDKWGGTELATQYNAGSNVRVKIRKYYQGTSSWGSWTEFITSGNYTDYVSNCYWANVKISSSANYLTTPYFNYTLFRNTANNGAAVQFSKPVTNSKISATFIGKDVPKGFGSLAFGSQATADNCIFDITFINNTGWQAPAAYFKTNVSNSVFNLLKASVVSLACLPPKRSSAELLSI